MNQSTSSQVGRRPEFVTLIAIYQFVTAGILFLLSCLIPAVIFPWIFFYVGPSEGVFVSIVMATGALALFIGFGFASIVVGWGLLRMREWARLGAIVLGAFALIGFPIWTIVAILVLVYMTSEEARAAFSGQNTGREGDPRYHDAVAATAAYKTEPTPRPEQSPLDDTRPMGYPAAERTTAGGTAEPRSPVEETRRIDAIPMPPPADPAEATELLYDQEADVSDHYQRWRASLAREPAVEQDTREVDAIPMPPPADPAEATELLYDQEADVSDHYQRWKASLAQEPAVEQDTREVEAIPEQPMEETEAVETAEPPVEPEPERKPERTWGRPSEEAGMDERILESGADDPGDEPGESEPEKRQ